MAAHVNFDLDDAYDDANAHKDGARPLARLGSGCGEPLCGVLRRGGEVNTIGEAHGAAVISAFIGGISPHAAMTVALASFRGLPFGELTEEDLRHAREHDGRADGDTPLNDTYVLRPMA